MSFVNEQNSKEQLKFAIPKDHLLPKSPKFLSHKFSAKSQKESIPTLAPSCQKKSSLQEPLCFAKSLKSATSLHAGNFTEGFDYRKPVTMVQSQIVSSANVEPKQFNRLANMAKHVEDHHDFHHFNDTPKTESLYSSSIFTRKQTNTHLQLGKNQNKIPSNNKQLFFTKAGKGPQIHNPEFVLQFKKKQSLQTIYRELGAVSSQKIELHKNEHHINEVKNPNKCAFKKQQAKQDLESTAGTITIDKPVHLEKPLHKVHSLQGIFFHKNSHEQKQKFKIGSPALEDFLTIKHMGKGRFGDVSMVLHKATGFVCAMKTLQKSKINQQKLKTQVMRQITIQSYLKHNNIAQLYGFFHDNKNIYLLMELCTDGQLHKYLIERKRLPENQAKPQIKQLCEAVGYMHKQRILHRDIKPENIMMHQGVIKLCDFGWSVKMSLELRGTYCGTPIYLSPEILQGTKYDEKIDVWSIGVLTYEILVGKPPFKIKCNSDLNRIICDQVSFPSYVELSDDAKDFILHILQKNPNNRLGIEGLLKHNFLKQK